MLLQAGGDAVLFLLGLLIGTIVVALILYIATMLIISSQKAKDKVILIVIEALIAVLVLPIIIGAIQQVLSSIGQVLAALRVDGGGNSGYLAQLGIIFGFLILLAMTKFFLDTTWSSAVWISIITLFGLYVILTIFPELNVFLTTGL